MIVLFPIFVFIVAIWLWEHEKSYERKMQRSNMSQSFGSAFQQTTSGVQSLYDIPYEVFDVEEKSMQLTPFQEKHWSEQFKTLYKAGIVNADGSLSKEGSAIAVSMVLETNMDPLIEYARKKLDLPELPAPKKK